ncbi:response regulator transcription factor [Bacillus anthracis]|uniref:response regulator transcription factor n=1 Tax=Bacillus anthracis TaxID=1392 RepID=UPI0028474E51|nr:response regulator transcription factor [Bacillus anthracis]MDR4359427.1 response regulator transcription factor [Bacillus anthracis]
MEKNSILIVDDDQDIVRFMNVNLMQEGFKVFSAYNGEEALEIINNNSIQLAILDIMMPQMDGIELCRRIREKHSLPIIFLSAKSSDVDKVVGFSMGADDYIVKPFSPGELIARMEAVLRRYTKQEQQEEIQFGPILINEKSRKIEADGEPISLTVKEFDLLYFLCQHTGQVFSREQLLEKVWGYDYAGSTRTVDTHVKTMRLKLGEGGNYIQTVWGVGYKFEV